MPSVSVSTNNTAMSHLSGVYSGLDVNMTTLKIRMHGDIPLVLPYVFMALFFPLTAACSLIQLDMTLTITTDYHYCFVFRRPRAQFWGLKPYTLTVIVVLFSSPK
jgi:hypothetical protein